MPDAAALPDLADAEPELLSSTPAGAQGRTYLVTLADAENCVIKTGQRMLLQYEAGFSRIENYRAWLAWKKSRKILGKNIALALAMVRMHTMRQSRKRRGVQNILTRKKGIAAGQAWTGTFNGKPAWKRKPGRPPLPPSVWLAHYQARLKKKRKGKARGSKVKPPSTKSPRPSYGAKKGSGDKLKIPSNSKEWLDTLKEAAHEGVAEFVESAIETIVEQTGETIREKVQEVTIKAIQLCNPFGDER